MTVEEQFIQDEQYKNERKQVEKILSLLTSRQKEIIYYRFIQEMSMEEICTLMDLNYQSAQNLIQRSLKKIRSSMGDINLFLFLLFAMQIKYFFEKNYFLVSIKVSLTALISKKVICMHKNYIGYKADQLLNDDRFVQWLLSPTAEEDLFWDELKQKDKELAEEIDIARSFIGHLRRDIKHPDFSSIDEIVLWNRINTENRKDKLQKKTISVIKTLVGVAAVVFLCLFVVQEYYFSDKDVDYQAILNTTEPIFNSTGEIELVLSGNKKIAIQEKESQVEYNHKGEINVNSQKVATEIEEKDNTKIFNQLIVPYGRRSSLTFSDGTKIWVNSGSKVIYPVSFEKKNGVRYMWKVRSIWM